LALDSTKPQNRSLLRGKFFSIDLLLEDAHNTEPAKLGVRLRSDVNHI
jgi:hypothetical protein